MDANRWQTVTPSADPYVHTPVRDGIDFDLAGADVEPARRWLADMRRARELTDRDRHHRLDEAA